MYDNGTLVRDFIPLKSIESGKSNVICLFDKVNHKFYYNAGSGTFSGS